MTVQHKERAHSKFSASGAERWFACQGSVGLCEGLPDKDSIWSIEGTQAHEVLECLLLFAIKHGHHYIQDELTPLKHLEFKPKPEMIMHGRTAANFILKKHHSTSDSIIQVETRIYLDFIHPEAFGTFDGAVIDYFGTLHVFDYKYGAGHSVSPTKNLQMIFYGLGLGHKINWNVKRVKLWIIQPRIKGYDGPTYWDVPTLELKSYTDDFKRAVDRVEKNPKRFVEGDHCYWCKGKGVCPLKQETKLKNAIEIFKK